MIDQIITNPGFIFMGGLTIAATAFGIEWGFSRWVAPLIIKLQARR